MVMKWLVIIVCTVRFVAQSAADRAILSLVSSGDWAAAESLIRSGTFSDAERTSSIQELKEFSDMVNRERVNIEATFRAANSRANSEVDKMGAASSIRVVAPTFQWAQNASTVFIEVKYSARWSAPAATGAKVESVIFENRAMKLRARPPNGEQSFELDLVADLCGFGHRDGSNSFH